MKWTMISVFIFAIKAKLKQNVSETEKKIMFSKKCKNMSTKQDIVSDVVFKACSFSSDFKG